MTYVIKWDGRCEPFEKKKVINTLLRFDAPTDVTEKCAQQIELKVYDGIPTKEILDMISKYSEQHNSSIAMKKDLKTALGMIKPKPDFEEYIRILLRTIGYKVTSNKVIQGFCVTHEIDGVAARAADIRD